jgi:hypothetical protein
MDLISSRLSSKVTFDYDKELIENEHLHRLRIDSAVVLQFDVP